MLKLGNHQIIDRMCTQFNQYLANGDFESLLLYWDRTQLKIGKDMIETFFSADCNDGSRCYSVEEK